MAPLILEGVYRDGRIEFTETPEGIAEGTRVTVQISGPLPDDEARQAAGDRFMARLKAGIPFGGPPYPSREELNERPIRTEPGPG